MRSEKQKATTVHGDVEYDVVECSSCGTELMKKDAYRFVVGRQVSRWDVDTDVNLKYEFRKAECGEGYVCEFCRNDPADFPNRTRTATFINGLSESEKFGLYLIGTFVVTTVAIWMMHAV